jgi:hypothetical protein
VAEDFVMSLGAHRVQAHGESFILLAGNKLNSRLLDFLNFRVLLSSEFREFGLG